MYGKVLEEAKAFPDFKFLPHEPALIFQEAIDKDFPAEAWPWDNIVDFHAKNGHAGRNTQAAKLATIDSMLLAKCDLFIGQFTSNVFRYAYELKTASCDCVAPYASLDSKWCFDWALHSATNPVLGEKAIIC